MTLLSIVVLWLAAEVVYAVVQRAWIARGPSAPARLKRAADLLFEPLADDVVTTEEPPFRARDVAHHEHGSVYAPGGVAEIELTAAATALGPLHVQPIVRRVGFDHAARRPSLSAVARWDAFVLDASGRTIRGALPRTPGMYVVEFVNATRARIAVSLFVSAESASAAVAILPTFTMWGYHRTSGFYPGHQRPSMDRRLAAIGRLGLVGRAVALFVRVAAKRLAGVQVSQPRWPVHANVQIDRFFETNHRWTKWAWDAEVARFEGIWNDDIDILIPFFALADAQGIAFRIASDLDVHRREEWLLRSPHWIFVGQESLTISYWAHLKRFADAGGRLTLWCPQGFGYRQVEYDVTRRTLSYVCSRGRRGFWNEPLEAADPPWDESEVFGFRFPSPDSAEATNPHRVQYDSLIVATPMAATPAGSIVRFPLWVNGAWRPGLNWMGGEPFRRVKRDAQVHIHVGGDPEVIGLGTYRQTAVVSPTFLGALWAYGAEQSLVELVFQQVVGAGVVAAEQVAVGR